MEEQNNNLIFNSAINYLKSSKTEIFGPLSFQKYANEQGFNKINTAQFISIDFLEKLNPLL